MYEGHEDDGPQNESAIPMTQAACLEYPPTVATAVSAASLHWST